MSRANAQLSVLHCRLMRWKVYADAGWFLDIPGFGPAVGSRPMRDIATSLQTAYNASFDATCMAQLLPGQVSAMRPELQFHSP